MTHDAGFRIVLPHDIELQQGAIQNLSASLKLTTLEGAIQTIPMGPVASQEAIKQLGTNGGGFFNANAAHPFENPTPWTNFLSIFLIFAIPSALVWTFGKMVGHMRHAWSIWAAMFLLEPALPSLWREHDLTVHGLRRYRRDEVVMPAIFETALGHCDCSLKDHRERHP